MSDPSEPRYTKAELRQIVDYLLEISSALLSFATVIPLGIYTLQRESLLPCLIRIYDIALPLLAHQMRIKQVPRDPSLRLVRHQLLRLCSVVLNYLFLDPIIGVQPTASTPSKLLQDLISYVQQKIHYALEDCRDLKLNPSLAPFVRIGSFLRQWNRHSHVIDLLEGLKRSQVTHVFRYNLDELIRLLQKATAYKAPTMTDALEAKLALAKATKFPEPDQSQDGTVNRLTEIFPDFSEDFARACLEVHQYDFNRTTDAILNLRLPLHLQRVQDRSSWTSSQSETKQPESAAPSVSLSALDEEQFQAFLARTGRVPLSANAKPAVLLNKFDDDTEADAARQVISRFVSEYDDEYDDAYDDFDSALRMSTSDEVFEEPDDPISSNANDAEETALQEDTTKAAGGANEVKADAAPGAWNSNSQSTSAPGPGYGRGRYRAQSASADPAKQYRWKQRNKGRVANHNRKQGAAAKFQRSVGSGPRP